MGFVNYIAHLHIRTAGCSKTADEYIMNTIQSTGNSNIKVYFVKIYWKYPSG